MLRVGDDNALDELDDRQRAVVELPVDASAVVVGAPGTGKTATLVARFARLLRSGVAPDEIVALTPTRQTATSLRDRLAAGLDVATPGPPARSTASFAFQIARAGAVAAGDAPPQLLAAGDEDRIMAELLAGDEEDAAAGRERWPVTVAPAVRASRQFRAELRVLSAECIERGIGLTELSQAGQEYDRPAWVAAASFLREHRWALSAMRSAHRDAAELTREAATLLAAAPHGVAGERQVGPAARLRAVLVDDAQELTPGSLAVLRALRRRGVAVVAFGDPDIGSGGFRGASPALFARLCDELGDVRVLDVPYRGAHDITHLVRRVTEAIGASGRVEHRRAAGAAVGDGSVSAFVTASPFEEIDAVARLLREWHVLEGVPWHRLAVIAHDTRQVADLVVELAAREVPTRASALPRPLGGDPVVRELAAFVALGIEHPDDRDYDALTSALLSPFGGLDAVGLRRLRARLRHAALRDAGRPPSPARELLLDALRDPIALAGAVTPEAAAAERVAQTLAKVHSESARGANVHELLWIVWAAARDGSGRPLAAAWRELATGTGVFSAEANSSLDALVALFDAAKRFVERAPNERPLVFLRRILDSAVPEDVLTAPDRSDSVAVLTPASALGTEFDGVVIAGMQEGVWPNLRLRGGALDGWRLADDLDAWRAGSPAPVAPAMLDRRRAALHDELRLLARAASRARRRLAVVAVDDDDLTPSPLLAFFPPPDRARHDDFEHPLTLRGLVAAHRRTLTTSPAVPARVQAAGQLAVLAAAEVPGAAPDQWFGLAPASAIGPLRDLEREAVRISPSQIERFEECPLDWAIRALGGDVRTWSAGAGTILHAAMEHVPSGDLAEIRALIDERWTELDFEAPWLSRKERAWADLLAQRLHRYLRGFHDSGAAAIGAETRFRLAIPLDEQERRRVREATSDTPPGPGTAVLSGSIDRIEMYPPGAGERLPVSTSPRVVVVDLKTGRSEARVSDVKVANDPQLAAYQLALGEGLIPGADPVANAGARLVVLSKTTQREPHYRIAHQAPMTPEIRAAFLDDIVRIARAMASDRFAAPVDAHCATARFGVCALHTVPAVSAS